MRTFGIKQDLSFDFEKDEVEDYMYLKSNLYKSSKFGKVYWYGYKFNNNVDSSTRTKIIKLIRGLSGNQLSEKDKREFVERPLVKLADEAPMRDIEAVVYPQSMKSDLNQFQYELIVSYFRAKPINIELVKEKFIGLSKFKKILIMDDIATTGATLDNILTVCKVANPELEVYIYSLIEKDS